MPISHLSPRIIHKPKQIDVQLPKLHVGLQSGRHAQRAPTGLGPIQNPGGGGGGGGTHVIAFSSVVKYSPGMWDI